MARESKAFGSQRARKAHLMRGTGGLSAEIADLRADAEEGFQNLEAREGFPELYYIDGAGPSAAGADMILKGVGFLQGQSFDELALWLGTSMVTITALKPGDSGFTIEITDGATAGAEVVTRAGSAFTIQIQAGVSTADQIATAINANGADSDGFLRAASGGGDAVNAVAAATAMAGGVGDHAANVVAVGGTECLPANTPGTAGAAAWADDEITVTVPALTPIVATDQANVTVMSDGTRADALGAVVQA
jgi:hypothetical protein